MKKITLSFFLLFITISSYCQSINKVTKAVVMKYRYDKWVDENTNYPDNMFVILDGNSIKVTNKNESKYLTYESRKTEKTSEYVISTWGAIDKDGDYCTVMMKKFYDQNGYIIMFIYPDFGLEYITE